MRKAKKGQSTIEFIFVFFAFIAFLSMSYNAVVAFALYQYFSYANFMAARAYQPSRATGLDQQAAALNTMRMYIPGIDYNKVGQDIPFSFSANRPLARIKQWMVPMPERMEPRFPMTLTFEVSFLTLPLVDDIKTFGRLTLNTSVFVGREPSKQECRVFFSDFFQSMGGSGPHGPEAMEDNGC